MKKGITKRLAEAHETGKLGTILPDTMSARSMLSRWARREGVKYITFTERRDLVVFFRSRLIDKLKEK